MDSVGELSMSCQQNGDVPKSPLPNRQLLPSVGKQASQFGMQGGCRIGIGLGMVGAGSPRRLFSSTSFRRAPCAKLLLLPQLASRLVRPCHYPHTRKPKCLDPTCRVQRKINYVRDTVSKISIQVFTIPHTKHAWAVVRKVNSHAIGPR